MGVPGKHVAVGRGRVRRHRIQRPLLLVLHAADVQLRQVVAARVLERRDGLQRQFSLCGWAAWWCLMHNYPRAGGGGSGSLPSTEKMYVWCSALGKIA
jgi:hypothetical protein